MTILSVKIIPTRKWKDPDKERWELVVERDKNRKESITFLLLRRKVEDVKSYLKPE